MTCRREKEGQPRQQTALSLSMAIFARVPLESPSDLTQAGEDKSHAILRP